MLIGDFHDFHRLCGVIDCDDQHFRLARPRRMQQIGARGIAEIDLVAEAAQQLDLVRAVIEHRDIEAVRAEQTGRDLAEPAEAGDDGEAVRLDVVGLALLAGPLEARRKQPLVKDEQQRRGQHGNGDRGGQRICDKVRKHRVLNREGDQHESEFAALREGESKEQAVRQGKAEQARQAEEHRDFHRDQREDETGDEQRISRQQPEIDAGAHRDEEQAEQQPLERLDVAFQLMPEFAVGQHDSGEERAECGR